MGTSSVDVASDRVAALTAREEEVFRSKRARSRELWEEAKKVIPRGVPSSFQDTPPQPVFIDYGKGSRVWDVDGNEYVDFHNGFGVMVVGHAHPAIVAAVDAQMHRGSHFAQPVAENIVVATRARPPLPAAAMAVHQQRNGVDARRDPPGARLHRSRADHQDRGLVPRPPRLGARLRRTADVSLIGSVEEPNSVPMTGGIPASTVELTTVVGFNDLEALEHAFAAHPGQVAGVIVEPAMMNIGFVLPEPGYLAGVVEIAHRHGAVVIFDEVKTGVTIAPGGATERFGVVPDIVCLAKAIGGGLPCGAVGGRADIMATISDGKVAQLGTFNGNPLTTAASRATLLEVLTGQAYSHLDALTEELSGGLREVMSEYSLPFHVVSMAARGCVTYREEPVRNYRDYAAMDKSLAYISWLYQTNRGVLMAPGAEENWTLSVQHSSEDVRRYVDNFRELARDLKA